MVDLRLEIRALRTNATILRIDGAPAVLADNSRVYSEGTSISIRCSWQQPKYRRVFLVGVALEDVGAVIYVQGNQTAVFEIEGRVLLTVDREPASRLYEVMAMVPQVGLGLSNSEVYLKGA